MLNVKNLKKNYKSFSLDCSLEVKQGQITGLIGQNGAGKSTTFKAVLGLISYDSGAITVFGKDLESLTKEDKEKIGVVLSDSGFSGYLTINDIISILQATYKKFDRVFFEEKANKFGLPFNKKIKDFSTGMKAKLKILVAISHDARLLILDEPTTGLDVIARDELLLILKEYMEKDNSRAILISSHISSDLETLCDDVYIIDKGKVVLHEDTDILLDRYAVLKVNQKEYTKLDKQYILKIQKEAFGYSCLTNQRQYYVENYPHIIIEKGTIDNVITLVIKGEKQ